MKMRNFKDERFKGWCSRSVALKFESLDEKNRSVECIMTTEDPAIVFDWWNWKYIREIILMKGVEFESEVPFINSHKRDDIENLLGTTKEMRVEGDSLIGRNYFSSTAEKAWTLTQEGHLKNYSVGYQTFEENSIELKPNQEVEIDGRKFVNNYTDGFDMVIRKRTVIKENSSVILGADKRAKARAEGISAEDEDLQDELEKMFEKFEQKIESKINLIKTHGGTNMLDPKEKTQEQLRLEAISEIKNAMPNYGDKAKEFAEKTIDEILQGKEITETTLKEFYKSATDILIKSGGAAGKPMNYLGLNGQELKSYSSVRAIQNIIKGNRSGFEFDLNQELETKTGMKSGPKEILMPADIQNVALREIYPNLFKRAHSMGVDAEGGYFVTPTYRADLLKEVLRNDTVLGRLGSTIITGLKGQFQMPKIVSGLTMYNAAENTASSASYVVAGLETVDQKRWTGNTKVGRQLIMNIDAGIPGFDQLLIKDLYDSANVKMDYDGINGSGTGNNPRGILNQSGPAAATLATMNWINLINFKRLIAKAKGRKEDLRWGCSVDVECALDVIAKVTGQPFFLRDDNGRVAGYAQESSNQIPDAVAILGFWPEFFTLLWGAEKLIVADQPSHTSDEIEISLHRYGNFFLRSSESFAIAEDAAIDVFPE